MTTLRSKLKEKHEQMESLRTEIRDLENELLQELWKDKPECTHSFREISTDKCPHATTIRGIIYCHNPNCHK